MHGYLWMHGLGLTPIYTVFFSVISGISVSSCIFNSQMQFSRLTPAAARLLHSIPRMPRYSAEGDYEALVACLPEPLPIKWLPCNTGSKECQEHQEVLKKLKALNATLSFTKADMSAALYQRARATDALNTMKKDCYLRRVRNHVSHVSHTLHRHSPTPMMRPTRFV